MNAVVLAQRLARNNAWSNLRLHRACAGLDEAAWRAQRTSFFPSLPRTLNHILIVDWYYVDALEGGTRGLACFADEVPFPDAPALAAAQRAIDLRFVAFTDRLRTDADLAAEVRMPRKNHVQVDTVANVILHLTTHQTHHRGQAHAMLAGTAVNPPQLDEYFLRGELHLREHELRELGLPIE